MTSPVSLPQYTKDDRKKFAIVQPGSYGDNLNSTLIFPQLKRAYVDCVLDVYTSTYYSSAFTNNPFIDRLIEYKADSKEHALNLVHVIPPHLTNCGYDHIVVPHPMINPGNWTSIKHGELGDNLICAWIRVLEDLAIDYEWPLYTVLKLTPAEIDKVTDYRQSVPMTGKRNVLMELGPESGQSFFDYEWALETIKYMLNGNTNLFLSRRHGGSDIRSFQTLAPEHVYFIGHLSLREAAELFNFCDVFFSNSSGLSNACNTNWCRQDTTWIEVINSMAVASAPIRQANKYFWLDNNLPKFIQQLKEWGL